MSSVTPARRRVHVPVSPTEAPKPKKACTQAEKIAQMAAQPDTMKDEYGNGGIDDAAIAALDETAHSGGEYVRTVMASVRQDNTKNKPNPFTRQESRSDVFYLPYNTFSAEKLLFADKPVACEGNGELVYINVKLSNTRNGMLCINAPTMACPTGFSLASERKAKKLARTNGTRMADGDDVAHATDPSLWKWAEGSYKPAAPKFFANNKMSGMLSFGKDWKENPKYLRFMEVMNEIEEACIQYIINNKQWMVKGVTEQSVRDNFRHIIYIGEDAEGVQYPPAIFADVSTAKGTQTIVLQKPDMIPVPPSSVTAGSWLSAVIIPRWIYRRKLNATTYQHSVNLAIGQSILHDISSFAQPGVCYVQADDVCMAPTKDQDQTPVAAVAAAAATTDGNNIVKADSDGEPFPDSDEERRAKATFSLTK